MYKYGSPLTCAFILRFSERKTSCFRTAVADLSKRPIPPTSRRRSLQTPDADPSKLQTPIPPNSRRRSLQTPDADHSKLQTLIPPNPRRQSPLQTMTTERRTLQRAILDSVGPSHYVVHFKEDECVACIPKKSFQMPSNPVIGDSCSVLWSDGVEYAATVLAMGKCLFALILADMYIYMHHI